MNPEFDLYMARRPAHWTERDWSWAWTVWHSSTPEERQRDRQALLGAERKLRKKKTSQLSEDYYDAPRVGTYYPYGIAQILGAPSYLAMGGRGH